jgi:hypothetical protein
MLYDLYHLVYNLKTACHPGSAGSTTSYLQQNFATYENTSLDQWDFLGCANEVQRPPFDF